MKNSLLLALVVLGLPTLAAADLNNTLTQYYDNDLVTFNALGTKSGIVSTKGDRPFDNRSAIKMFQVMDPKTVSYVFNATSLGDSNGDPMVQVSETKVFNQDKNASGDAAYTTRISNLYKDGSLRNSLLCVGHQNEVGTCAEATVRSCAQILKGYNDKLAAMQRNGAGAAAKKIDALKGAELQSQVNTCANLMSVYGDALKSLSNLNSSVANRYNQMAKDDMTYFGMLNAPFQPTAKSGFLGKISSPSPVMQAAPLTTDDLKNNSLSESADKFELMTKLVSFCRENRNRFDGSISDDGGVSGQKHNGAQ